MSNIFEKATQQKLRFATHKGMLSVEDLWDLPLTSNTGKLNLDDIAKDVNTKLSVEAVTSFVTKATTSNITDTLRLDILKHIIDTKLAAREVASKQREVAERKKALQTALAEKKVDGIAKLTEEEIEAELKLLNSSYKTLI